MNSSRKFKFIITIAVALVIALCTYVHIQKQDSQQNLLLNSLQKNDFFIFSISEFSNTPKARFDYAIAKIINVDNLNVDYQIGTSSYRYKKDLIKAIRLDTLMIDGYFSNKQESITFKELKKLLQTGAIKELLRPNGLYIYGGLVLEQEVPTLIAPKYDLQELNELAVESYQVGDIDTAFSLFKQGAESGESWAQINLANMYIDGEGTQVNIDTAIYWLNLAYQSGNKSAEEKLKDLCNKQKQSENKSCTINN